MPNHTYLITLCQDGLGRYSMPQFLFQVMFPCTRKRKTLRTFLPSLFQGLFQCFNLLFDASQLLLSSFLPTGLNSEAFSPYKEISYHFLSLTGIAGINGKWMGLTSLASLYSWEHSNTSLRLLRLSLALGSASPSGTLLSFISPSLHQEAQAPPGPSNFSLFCFEPLSDQPPYRNQLGPDLLTTQQAL